MLLRVAVLGGAIMLVGAGALVIAFRAYGDKRREFRATLLIAGLLFFVILVCLLLMRISMLR